MLSEGITSILDSASFLPMPSTKCRIASRQIGKSNFRNLIESMVEGIIRCICKEGQPVFKWNATVSNPPNLQRSCSLAIIDLVLCCSFRRKLI